MSKNTINILLRSSVSIALLLWLALTIDWFQLVSSLRMVTGIWIIAAIICIVLSIAISTWKWQEVLKAQGMELPWQELWNAYWEGQFFNNFLPSSIGGDAMRIVRVGKLSGDTAGATASVIIERILATIGLSVTGIMGGLMVRHPDYRIISIFAALIVLCTFLMMIIIQGRLPAWIEKHSGRISNFLKGMQVHGNRIQGKGCHMIKVLLLSVFFQVAVVGVNYCIFQALHIKSVGILEALYIVPLASVAAMLPVGINGYGLREGAYVALLGMFSVNRGVAFAASLLFAFLVSLCSLYGAWVWLTHKSKEVMTNE
ncbi:MAG: flippase-like domain-containing protein [Syntrophomonadaceae bacterium]|nr:flippase-like domain-containing protein [Syntrophomonadaceae bacterium]